MSKFREIQGWDGQTLFHRILLATVRGVTSKTAVEYVCLTKNCCIIVCMQKVSSIHTFIPKILGSHELNGHTHSYLCPSKNYLSNFWLLAPACKKSVHSIHS